MENSIIYAFEFAVSTLYLIQTKTILIENFLIYLNKKKKIIANVLHQVKEMEKLLLFLLCSLKCFRTPNDDSTFLF